ncbi:hypothetical protein NBRC3280_3436 [Acetobacter pasteurianus NBRC 3280]|uniref:Uncharacterized protein n=1 Tax=Acetobacter pasteurianus NBRC 3278 TaxID=1226660 RepID=A0A401X9Q5_ACEPA|nr:hypothetical protein NBRC3278_3561 [Acetobacter pasteurianus NBRC 3278]GCD70801.1 hypothetical protein NBRC3280_3436 [Acetobacter pasteurianus NBRC 3280]
MQEIHHTWADVGYNFSTGIGFALIFAVLGYFTWNILP